MINGVCSKDFKPFSLIPGCKWPCGDMPLEYNYEQKWVWILLLAAWMPAAASYNQSGTYNVRLPC